MPSSPMQRALIAAMMLMLVVSLTSSVVSAEEHGDDDAASAVPTPFEYWIDLMPSSFSSTDDVVEEVASKKDMKEFLSSSSFVVAITSHYPPSSSDILSFPSATLSSSSYLRINIHRDALLTHSSLVSSIVRMIVWANNDPTAQEISSAMGLTPLPVDLQHQLTAFLNNNNNRKQKQKRETTCDDSDLCTTDYYDAVAMKCINTATFTCSDGSKCTTDLCNPATGLCEYTAIVCNDYNNCTTDACSPASGCVFTDIACDDQSLCTKDQCDQATGQCVFTEISCDDHNACSSDSCAAATGCYHTMKTCDDRLLCTNDRCDNQTGDCVFTAIQCVDDHNNCTTQHCDDDTGVCVTVSTASSCNDNNQCTVDSCSPTLGCVFTPRDCSDDDLCTEDSCVAGECIHSVLTCDDSNPCTRDECFSASGCSHVVMGCDDNSNCTIDSCSSITGLCEHQQVDCDDDDLCTTDSCDAVLGCVHSAMVCDDNNPCTVNLCSEGVCDFLSTPTNCSDNDLCTSDSCDKLIGCQHTNISSSCVLSDYEAICHIPLCSAELGCYSIIRSCDDNDPCTVDSVSCNETLGGCLHTAITCDDHSLCTTDSCVNGVCVFTEAVNCLTAQSSACTRDYCNNQTGECVHDQLTCNDGDLCTVDSCDVVTGCLNTPINCNDSSACTIDECIAGACSHTAVECDDHSICTTESCDVLLGCVYSNRTDCVDYNPCTVDSCDAIQGCQFTPITCDDNNSCTQDLCLEGVCSHTATVCANDNNECVNSVCDPATGICGDVAVNCSDTDPCTVDLCDPGTGCYHEQMSCDDGVLCTEDVCAAGVCTHPIVNCSQKGYPTNDKCTVYTCDAASGQCYPHSKQCDDGDLCTVDSCDSLKGCVFAAVDCSDNNVCTDNVCVAGVCQMSYKTCDDNNTCTVDSCDSIKGCVNAKKQCDDNDLCTVDYCEQETGNCMTTAVNCTDSDPCTEDTCSPVHQCQHTLKTCNDLDACTVDSCSMVNGSCLNIPISCDDNNSCTDDSCNAYSGCLHSTTVCDDYDSCTIDSCSPSSGCLHVNMSCAGVSTAVGCSSAVCKQGSCVCNQCSAGYYLSSGSSSSSCVACPYGYYSSSAGAVGSCVRCDASCSDCDSVSGKCLSSCSIGYAWDSITGKCSSNCSSSSTDFICLLSGACMSSINTCLYSSCNYWCDYYKHCVNSKSQCPGAVSSTSCPSTSYWCPSLNKCVSAATICPSSASLPAPFCPPSTPYWCHTLSTCLPDKSSCYQAGCSSPDLPYYCPNTQSCAVTLSGCSTTCSAPSTYCQLTGRCALTAAECSYPISCASSSSSDGVYCSSTGSCVSSDAECYGADPSLSCGSSSSWCPFLQRCVDDVWSCPFYWPPTSLDFSAISSSHICPDGSLMSNTAQCLPPCPPAAPKRCTWYGTHLTTSNTLCVASSSTDCPPLKCSGSTPYLCSDGSTCSSSLSLCPSSSACESAGLISCSDGSCKSSFSQCPPCPSGYTDVDGKGYCSSSGGVGFTCSTGTTYCPTLSKCLSSSLSCPHYCPSSSASVWCDLSNKCVSSSLYCLLPHSLSVTGVSSSGSVASVDRTVLLNFPTRVISGAPTTFYLQTRIWTGANLLTTSTVITATAINMEQTYTAVPQGNGLYALTFTYAYVGTISMTISINGQAMAASPFTIIADYALAPSVASARFTGASGSEIAVVFDGVVSSESSDCGVLISDASLVSLFGGVQNVQCRWSDSRTLSIKLLSSLATSSSSSLVMYFKPNVIYSCSSTHPCTSLALSSSTPVTILSSSIVATKPTAVISGDSLIARCASGSSSSSLVLSGEMSRPGTLCYKKPLVYSWSVTPSLLTVIDMSTEVLKIPSSVMTADTQYTFSLTVTDCTSSASATTTHKVMSKSDESMPTINVLTPTSLTLKQTHSTSLQAHVSLSPCSTTATPPSSLTYQWVVSSSGSQLTIANPTQLTTKVTAGSSIGVFTVHLTVTIITATTTTTTSDEITITVIQDDAPTSTIIGGGSPRLVAEDTSFSLSSSTTGGYSYSWNCQYDNTVSVNTYYTTSLIPCTNRSNSNTAIASFPKSATLTITPWTLIPGIYYITLTTCSSAASSSLCSSSSTEIQIIPMNTLKPVPVVYATVIKNNADQIVIEGSATSRLSLVLPFTYQWSCSSLLDLSSTTTSTTLSIPVSKLVEGVTYKVKFTVTDSYNAVSAYSYVDISTSLAPYGGSVSLISSSSSSSSSQQQINSLVSPVSLSLDRNWVTSSNQPFVYWFTAVYEDNNVVVLTPQMTSQVTTTATDVRLSFPSSDDNNNRTWTRVTIKAMIMDSVTSMTTTVVVASSLNLTRYTMTTAEMAELVATAHNTLTATKDYLSFTTSNLITTLINTLNTLVSDNQTAADMKPIRASLMDSMKNIVTASASSLDEPALRQWASNAVVLTSVVDQLTDESVSDAFTSVSLLITASSSRSLVPSSSSVNNLLSSLENILSYLSTVDSSSSTKRSSALSVEEVINAINQLTTLATTSSLTSCGDETATLSSANSQIISRGLAGCSATPVSGTHDLLDSYSVNLGGEDGLMYSGMPSSYFLSMTRIQRSLLMDDVAKYNSTMTDSISIRLLSSSSSTHQPLTVSGLTRPVQMTFSLRSFTGTSTGMTPQCVWYNTVTESWSATGCTSSQYAAGFYITCSCTHLTEFSVLAVNNPTDDSSSSSSDGDVPLIVDDKDDDDHDPLVPAVVLAVLAVVAAVVGITAVVVLKVMKPRQIDSVAYRVYETFSRGHHPPPPLGASTRAADKYAVRSGAAAVVVPDTSIEFKEMQTTWILNTDAAALEEEERVALTKQQPKPFTNPMASSGGH